MIFLSGCVHLFIHSTAEGHLGCFQVLAIMYKAALKVSICRFLYGTKLSTPLSKSRGYNDKRMLCFVRNLQIVFQNDCIPTSNVWGFLWLHTSLAFGVVNVLEFAHSNRSAVVSHWFKLHFPSDMWCSESCAVYISFLVRCLLSSLIHCLIGESALLLSFMCSWCILENNPLLAVSFANSFIQSVAFLSLYLHCLLHSKSFKFE